MDKKLFIILVIIYRIISDFVYRTQISSLFMYQGFADDHTSTSYIISWLFLVLVTLPIFKFLDDDSDYAISCVALLFYLTRIVPLSSILYFVPQPSEFVILNLLYWVLLLVLFGYRFRFIERWKFTPVGNKTSVNILAFYCVTIVLIISGIYAHFRLQLSLEDVYSLREDSRNFNMPLILRYLFPPIANILPIIIIYYYKNEKQYIVLLLLLIGLFNFSINGSKSAIFKILLCTILVLTKFKNIKKLMLPLCIFLISISIFEFFQYSSSVISTLVIRRSLYIPCIIDTFVYDYISNNNILLFDAEAATKFDFIIGDNYFGNEADRANNGMFSDAYKNLGALGCLIMPLFIAIFVKVFSIVTNGQDRGVIAFAALIITTTLGSTSFTTCLLTHGLFLLLLSLYYMPKINQTAKIRI